MNYRITVTISGYGGEEAVGERCLEGFLATAPETDPVVDQNTAQNTLTVTFAVEAENANGAFDLGREIFAAGVTAAKLDPDHGEIIEVNVEKVPVDELELQPA